MMFDGKQRAKFERLLKLKRSVLPKLLQTGKHKDLR